MRVAAEPGAVLEPAAHLGEAGGGAAGGADLPLQHRVAAGKVAGFGCGRV
jgi:hypothetical protein